MPEMSAQERLTSRQYTALLAGSAFGAGILTLPRYLCAAASQDAWGIPLLAGGAMCLSAACFLLLCRRFPGMTFPQQLQKILPLPLANGILLLFLAYFLTVAASSIRIVAEVTLLYLLPNTPLWAVALVYCLFVGYTLSGGLRCVGRFNELTGFVLLFAFLLLLPSLREGRITNLSPMFTTDMTALLAAVPMACYSFGISLLIPLFLPLTDDRSKAAKHTWPTLCFVIAAFSLITLTSVCVLGADTSAHMLFPVITLYKSVSVPVIERLDLFFLTLWTVLAVRPCLNFALAAVRLTNGLFQNRLPRRWLSAGIGLFLFFSMLLQSDIVGTIRILHWLGYVFLFLGIALPVLLLISSRKKVVPCHDSNR